MIYCEDCNNFRELIDNFKCDIDDEWIEPDQEASQCYYLDLIEEVQNDRTS